MTAVFVHGVPETPRRMGATVATIEGSGHWWMHHDPAGKAAILESFWASL
jgi:6-phosphogluconolactonase/glucosamine-6-phosphate isomerase/deaminase